MERNHGISKLQREYQEENRSEVRNALYADIESALQQRYGPSVDETIRERVRLEWETWSPGSPERADLADLYLLVRWLKKNKEPYWFHGSTGANFILYLLGITSGNLLPPHYYCPKCHQVIWCDNYKDGFDLPPGRICEKDGALLCQDGHNIPWQTAPHCFTGMMFYQVSVAKSLDQVCFPSFPGLDISYELDKARISPQFFEITPDAQLMLRAMEDERFFLEEWITEDAEESLRTRPTRTFGELTSKLGLLWSCGAWDDTARQMVEEKGYALSNLITCWEDVFFYLKSHGFSDKDGRRGMSYVRKGLGKNCLL